MNKSLRLGILVAFIIISAADFAYVMYYCVSDSTDFMDITFPYFKALFIVFIGVCWWFSTDIHKYSVIAFLALAAIGDVCLEYDASNVLMAIGGLSFAASHVFAVLMFNPSWKKVFWPIYFMAIPGAVLHLGFLVPEIFMTGGIYYSLIAYVILLLAAYTASVARAGELSFKSISFWSSYIGYSFYIFSDWLLFRRSVGYRVNIMRGYGVMLTYYIGHVLILLGVILEVPQTEKITTDSAISPKTLL